MRTLRALGALTLLLTVIAIVPAQAALWDLGGPIEGGSWLQRFQAYNTESFNYLRLDLISAPGQSEFEAPVFNDFNRIGWGETLGELTQAAASGTDESLLRFTLHFTGDQTDGVTFRYVAYQTHEGHAPEWKDAAYAHFNGHQWSIHQLNPEQWDPGVLTPIDPVPEPSSMLLVGSGATMMVGAWAVRRRRSRA